MTQHKEQSDATSGQVDPKSAGLGRSSNKRFYIFSARKNI